MSQAAEKINDLYLRLISSTLKVGVLKWMFTWLLALFPVLFIVYKDYLFTGQLDWDKICGSGEIFLVSIVMIAEPLGGLVLSDKKSSRTLFLVMMIIVALVSLAYNFCIIDLNKELNIADKLTIDHSIKGLKDFHLRLHKTSQASIVSSFILGLSAVIMTHSQRKRFEQEREEELEKLTEQEVRQSEPITNRITQN